MYIPKNKIQAGLVTRGNEFKIQGTNVPYIGEYYEIYNGDCYSGTGPDDPSSRKLTKLTSATLMEKPLDVVIKKTYNGPIPPTPSQQVRVKESTTFVGKEVAYFQKANNDATVKKGIEFYMPQPTAADYTLGEIQRYFLKKVNEVKYWEVSKETYEDIKSKNTGYQWFYYTPFSFAWQISGDKTQVEQTNIKVVAYYTQKHFLENFDKFLKFDYLKFYK